MQRAIREATADDVDALFRIRTAVRENAMTMAELAEVHITPATITEMIVTGSVGAWVAIDNNDTVGFSMSKQEQREVFALFVLPAHEGRGHGFALLSSAVEWLRLSDSGAISLSTDSGTRAHGFYLKHGWVEDGQLGTEVRLQLAR